MCDVVLFKAIGAFIKFGYKNTVIRTVVSNYPNLEGYQYNFKH